MRADVTPAFHPVGKDRAGPADWEAQRLVKQLVALTTVEPKAGLAQPLYEPILRRPLDFAQESLASALECHSTPVLPDQAGTAFEVSSVPLSLTIIRAGLAIGERMRQPIPIIASLSMTSM